MKIFYIENGKSWVSGYEVNGSEVVTVKLTRDPLKKLELEHSYLALLVAEFTGGEVHGEFKKEVTE